MPLKEEVLDQFLGDESFPIGWTSETEQLLFWVYDDLHCPKPLSPMYEDIGGWWLSCDHMFRRFGTPFATDWIYKNINGYLYTAAIPAEAGLEIATQEYDLATRPIVPQAHDAGYAGKIGAYLGAVLPVYGHNFVDWWRTRFVPEMQRNFDYIEGMLDKKGELSLADTAVLLEDAIDMHDRHWKIHWMLNFAQLSATLNLRAVMEKTHGKIDEVLLGRLQNSASDRNWDKIRALWEMKEQVKGDAELAKAFDSPSAVEIVPRLQATERGRRFIDEKVVRYQKEFGWHAVWSHEFVFPSFREDMIPVIQLVRDQYASGYDYPAAIARLKADIDAAAVEILQGLEGEALEEMRAANEINLKMAPLTPDHHFYIDQGANAHVRLVLIALGEKLVEMGVLDRADDVIQFHYNELRAFVGNPTGIDGRAIVAAARAQRQAAEKVRPRDWVGTVTATQLAFPYLNLWGFPEKFYRSKEQEFGVVKGIAGSPGVVEGVARVVMSETEFDSLQVGEILVCEMTNPAWQVLYGKIIAVVTDAGGTVSHPAVLAREYGIPAVVGSSVATTRIKTGDRLRVDGGTGVVEILEASTEPAPALAGVGMKD
ncbi:MAG: PEP-utilizing protein [Chloroflexi bacterium RBG_16_70_13]|nr:MAG: PEP-utilizing protein [Chloroflexi bacterium RBG_16_70_13]